MNEIGFCVCHVHVYVIDIICTRNETTEKKKKTFSHQLMNVKYMEFLFLIDKATD